MDASEISKNTFFAEHLPVAASKTFIYFIFVLIQRGNDIPEGLFFLST